MLMSFGGRRRSFFSVHRRRFIWVTDHRFEYKCTDESLFPSYRSGFLPPLFIPQRLGFPSFTTIALRSQDLS
ncbi:hypothetical protein L1987_57455 [Smallanthus sonchifolius]|uniref:Uncharacterized protein n=1 Tax=Smallanthus sonchifolius TaxID=185202 RepID=A0ACB9DD22_9ASTR|nr:hypothetical protein L1987_57455 [Smallanthus sonchifolius]